MLDIDYPFGLTPQSCEHQKFKFTILKNLPFTRRTLNVTGIGSLTVHLKSEIQRHRFQFICFCWQMKLIQFGNEIILKCLSFSMEDSPQKQLLGNLTSLTEYSGILNSPPGYHSANVSYGMSSDEYSSPQSGYRGNINFFLSEVVYYLKSCFAG